MTAAGISTSSHALDPLDRLARGSPFAPSCCWPSAPSSTPAPWPDSLRGSLRIARAEPVGHPLPTGSRPRVWAPKPPTAADTKVKSNDSFRDDDRARLLADAAGYASPFGVDRRIVLETPYRLTATLFTTDFGPCLPITEMFFRCTLAVPGRSNGVSTPVLATPLRDDHKLIDNFTLDHRFPRTKRAERARPSRSEGGPLRRDSPTLNSCMTQSRGTECPLKTLYARCQCQALWDSVTANIMIANA